MNGTINAVDDINGGPGAGIYVNGNIKHQNNAPVINLSDTVKITSSGNGIYSAGYATYNINGALIEGIESGIGMKSGIFNINDGIVRGTGSDKTPTSGNNNGINPSGVAIQMESNPGYSGDMELYIKDGTFESNNSNVIYEYTTGSNPNEIYIIDLKGGNYTSKIGKDVFSFSDDFNLKGKRFISGGTYSSDPKTYLKSGYDTVKKSNNEYEVVSNTMSVFKESNEKNNNLFIILIIITFIIIGIISYLKRDKILNLIKK